MGKYLKLRFEDAGVFPFHEKGSRLADGTLVNNAMTRVKRQSDSGSIGVNQVSNMLHVLANKRPIKSFPRTYAGNATPDQSHLDLKRVESIFDMAKKSHIKIDNIFKQYKSDRNNLENANPYYSDFMQLSKNIFNSYAHKSISINENWALLKNHIDDDELFSELIQSLNVLLNKNVLEYRKNNIISEIIELSPIKLSGYTSKNILIEMLGKDKHPLEGLMIKLLDNGRTPVALQLLGLNSNGSALTVKGRDLKSTVLNSNGVNTGMRGVVLDNTRLSGKLIVYIDDWYEEQIRNGKGYATLLDDGVVFIEDVVDENYFLSSELDGFVELIKLKEHEDSSKIIKE